MCGMSWTCFSGCFLVWRVPFCGLRADDRPEQRFGQRSSPRPERWNTGPAALASDTVDGQGVTRAQSTWKPGRATALASSCLQKCETSPLDCCFTGLLVRTKAATSARIHRIFLERRCNERRWGET